MKKKIVLKTFLPLVAFLMVFTSCQKTNKQTKNAPIYKKKYKEEILKSRDDLRSYLISSSVPGMSVCVSIDGEIVWSEGIGVASKELKAPATRETKFRIGNASEILTSYLIAKLHEQGKLDLTHSFYKYVPNFPKKKYDFTLLELGSSVSGFRDMKMEDLVKYKDLKNLKEYVQKLENDTLVYEPDTYFNDSEYNYALLGILAENIGNEKFSKLVKNQILDTLNIENTLIDYQHVIIPNRSETYYRDFIARLIKAPEVNMLPFAPTLGYLSTADDLNQLAQQILTPGFFNQETLDLFYNKHRLSGGQEVLRSFGWISTTDRFNRKLIAKLGTTIGGSSAVGIFPDQKLVVTLCSNLGDDIGELPIAKIADKFLEKLDPMKEMNEEKKSSK
ncbi:serine hydrolase domain-containing protein [uncultured Sunxiuqinia sp.]|uniref:serine hydrolase domain-containing protein n=1 Tax=uncultured Sunxiuqinia sp. TaxID=1573825 RepID=UPI002AA8392E|nr:serine hydrolase domain-containing protein [uncultured Sunxiuqinia sp.]